ARILMRRPSYVRTLTAHLSPGLVDDLLERDLSPIAPLALIRSFHEGIKLDCLLRTDGHHARAEHLDDLEEQHVVAIVAADRRFAVFADRLAAIAFAVAAIFLAEHTRPPIRPGARHLDLPIRRGTAL